MILHITKLDYLSDYKVAVSFNNGEHGIADLSPVMDKGVFKTLKPIEKFAEVRLDKNAGTIVWPGDIDLAPEYVYYQAFKDKPQYQKQFEAWGYVS